MAAVSHWPKHALLELSFESGNGKIRLFAASPDGDPR